MKSDFVLAFDIGSSKIRAMLAGRGLNNTFKVKGYKEVEYDGFFEGKFLNPEKLPSIFDLIVGELELQRERINKMYIGVPAEFSSVSVVEETLNFGLRRKVKKQDVDSLFYLAGEKSKSGEVEVVSVSPLSFTLDGLSSLEPIGESATTITAKLSIIYANREFIELFNSIASGLDFEVVEYISEPLAQAQYIVPKEKREDVALLVDGGDLTTSIAFIKGDGLSALASVSRGGGFITNDLSEAFDLSMSEADRLKKQIVLSIKGGQNDIYELTTDLGQTTKISLNFANEVVAYRIEELAEVISKCLQMNYSQFESYLPIYLTGGGISKIKGGRDYLAKCLGRNVTFGLPNIPGKEKAELASIYSLINSAIN